MHKLMTHTIRRNFGAFCAGLATTLLAVSPTTGVPIDLTGATPSVSGPTTLHIAEISTLGSSYWANFRWNEGTHEFDVSAYGREGTLPPPKDSWP